MLHYLWQLLYTVLLDFILLKTLFNFPDFGKVIININQPDIFHTEYTLADELLEPARSSNTNLTILSSYLVLIETETTNEGLDLDLSQLLPYLLCYIYTLAQ